jgi:hypothetical protein
MGEMGSQSSALGTVGWVEQKSYLEKIMTPTLFGRWQTRCFLLATIGTFVSLPFVFNALSTWGEPGLGVSYFWVVFYVGVFGLGWDVLYDFLQKFMWDHDWPGAFQFLAAIAEGAFLGLVILFFGLPGLASASFNIPWFIVHYSTLSVVIYFLSWTVMRLFFPRWRFKGGEWIGKWKVVSR